MPNQTTGVSIHFTHAVKASGDLKKKQLPFTAFYFRQFFTYGFHEMIL
jgi:hypothetical protein